MSAARASDDGLYLRALLCAAAQAASGHGREAVAGALTSLAKSATGIMKKVTVGALPGLPEDIAADSKSGVLIPQQEAWELCQDLGLTGVPKTYKGFNAQIKRKKNSTAAGSMSIIARNTQKDGEVIRVDRGSVYWAEMIEKNSWTPGVAVEEYRRQVCGFDPDALRTLAVRLTLNITA